MKIEKISAEAVLNNSMERLSNRPTAASRFGRGGMTPHELKAYQDRLARIAIDKINELIALFNAGASPESIAAAIMTPIPVNDTDGEFKTLYEVMDDLINGDAAGYFKLNGLTEDNLQAELERLEEKIAEGGGGGGGSITSEQDPTVPDWAKQPEKPKYTAQEVGARPDTWTPTASDVGALPAGTKIPSKTSDLSNDSGFVTRLVSDLINYYTKSQTYTRDEINALVSNIPKFSIEVVDTLPTSGISESTVYLLKTGTEGDLYTEYIYVKNAWEPLGRQRVDLTGYATEDWVNQKLSDYLRGEDLTTAINLALASAKESGEFDGSDGQRGTGILKVSTTPTSYTTSTAGVNPIKRMSLSTIKNEAGVSEVLVGDCIAHSYYLYHIYYLDATYAYMDKSQSIRGATGAAGADGKSAYAYAQEGGYTGTEAAFAANLAREVPKTLSLGIASDGLIYLFVNGQPVGTGILQGQSGDVFGYVDENNTIVLNGNLADGTYTLKYEMSNGDIVNIGNMVLDSTVYYTVTSNLTNCSISNSAKTVAQGESYSATITASDGYELKSVTVTMGGSAVSVSGGVINIASVTGDIVITAVAEEVKVAEPVTENITLLKDVSLKGTNFDEDRTGTTGYCATPSIDLTNIPKPCIIHLTGACWENKNVSDSSYIRCSILDTSGTKLLGDYTHSSKMPSGVTMVHNTENRQDVTVTVTGNNIGKVRFAACYGIAGDNSGTNNFADAKATLTYTPAS